jgi:hypothetical protein
MPLSPFKLDEILAVREALGIAEERTGDFYKFSVSQWKRHSYEVKTLTNLKNSEIAADVFALLNKGLRAIHRFDFRTKKRDFYFICLQDHNILDALNRDRDLNLRSLMIYIFTHELVHIVRFCNFHQRFDALENNQEEEERVVHQTTYDILKKLNLPKMDYILESYRNHRICDAGAFMNSCSHA